MKRSIWGLKKAKTRLLTRAAQIRDCVVGGAYRAVAGSPIRGPRDPLTGGIQPGVILIADGTPMPESTRLEGASDSNGWKSVASADRSEFERKIGRAGWIFFLMAGEIRATAFGFDRHRALRAATQRILAKVKVQKCNSLQITEVAAKSFLKLPYVRVSVQSRHLQERPWFDGR